MIWLSPLIVGLSLGILGGGGSILVVPILTYLFGLDPKIAIAYSLLIVGLTSLIGVIQNYKNISFNSVFKFGITASIGTFLGAKLAFYFSSQFQMILFAIIMLITSYKMFKNKKKEAVKINKWLLPLEGFGVGILSGIIGVGGGFLIVPVLLGAGNLSIKKAIPTSLIIISLKSLFGTMGYLGQIDFNIELISSFVGISILGLFFGTFLSHKLPEEKTKKIFAIFLLIIAIFVILKNI
jgi:uncharacterized membrane protein YfcA